MTKDCYEAMRGCRKDQTDISSLSSFERHVFPLIGKTAVERVDRSAVLGVLESIGLTIPDTARCVLQRIGTVLDYALTRT